MSDRSEAETTELVLEWLRNYGTSIFVGVILGLVAIFGFRWYQSGQHEDRQKASATLMAMSNALQQKNYTAVKNGYLELEKFQDFRSYGALIYGSALQEQGNFAEAATVLEQTLASDDSFLSHKGKLLLAEGAIAEKKYDGALNLLEGLRGGPFQEEIPNYQASIYQAQGKFKEALEALKGAPQNSLTAIRRSALEAQQALQ